MTHDEFMTFVDSVLKERKELLKMKGSLYSHGQDRLSQFKLMSEITRQSPAMCAYVLASKHFTALCNAIRLDESIDVIEEITGDLINYMLLIHALWLEED